MNKQYCYTLQKVISEGLISLSYVKVSDNLYIGRLLMYDGTDLTVPLTDGGSTLAIAIGEDTVVLSRQSFDLLSATVVSSRKEMNTLARKFKSSIKEWKKLGGKYNLSVIQKDLDCMQSIRMEIMSKIPIWFPPWLGDVDLGGIS